MHADKISEIIAHFIGLFETWSEANRPHARALDGHHGPAPDPELAIDHATSSGHPSRYELQDYDPGVNVHFNATLPKKLFQSHYEPQLLHRPLGDHSRMEHPEAMLLKPHGGFDLPARDLLTIHEAPGDTRFTITQATVLRDDDVLDMTDGQGIARDLAPVLRELKALEAMATEASPFAGLKPASTPDDLVTLTDRIAAFRAAVETAHPADPAVQTEADGSLPQGPAEPLVIETDNGVIVTGSSYSGTRVNGEKVEDAPVIKDLMPDRGLATPTEKPEGTDGPLTENAPPSTSITVEAGANVVVNVTASLETGMVSRFLAVQGDYHQVNIISQVTCHADNDTVIAGSAASAGAEAEAFVRQTTVAMNVSTFTTTPHATPDLPTETEDGTPIFPQSWTVSVIEGDVAFVRWIEQYQLVTDNDTITMTRSGSDTTILSGGNASMNLTSFLGLGVQYDLIIIGGNVYDINAITQIAVLFDDDCVEGAGNGTVSTSGNFIANYAAITTIGSENHVAMPDSIGAAVNGITAREADIPDLLASDPHFAGLSSLNVLYITGNLFDATVIKQVAVLGDSDSVRAVADSLTAGSDDPADITIHTGNNAVVNIAEINDYDDFGNAVFVGGQTYSDAVLIQSGIISSGSGDSSETGPAAGGPPPLVNEAIAFLSDDDGGSADLTFTSGDDFSFANNHMPDVMQTVTA